VSLKTSIKKKSIKIAESIIVPTKHTPYKKYFL